MDSARGRRGFTLVELLVVLGVIIILISLLWTVVGRTREQSRRVTCASNLRQIMAGALAYSADNNEGPLLRPPNTDTDTFELLYPRYVSNFRVFECPSTDNRVTNVTHLRNNAREGRAGTSGHSYEIRALAAAGVTFPDGRRFPIETLKDPRRFKPNGCFLMDADDDAEGDRNNWPDKVDNHGAEGYNIGFLGGHVEFVRPGRGLMQAFLEGYYDPGLSDSIYQANGVTKQGDVFRYN